MSKIEIVKCASDMFFRYGIKSVNMIEIARQLGISKRTIYEQFESKEALVKACLRDMGQKLNLALEHVRAQESTVVAIEQLFRLCVECYTSHYKMAPSFYKDLVSYPQAEEVISEMKQQIRVVAQKIYEAGVRDGLFKDEADFEMLMVMWRCYNNNNIREDWSERVSPEAFLKTMLSFVRSLVTPQGEKLLDKFERELKNNIILKQ